MTTHPATTPSVTDFRERRCDSPSNTNLDADDRGDAVAELPRLALGAADRDVDLARRLTGDDSDPEEEGAGPVEAIADPREEARETPKRSPEEEDAAKWAAEAFVASAVAKEPKKESWWKRKDADDGEPSPEEQALLDAMDAAAVSALAGVSIDEDRSRKQ